MKRRSRLLRIAKWGGTLICTTLVVAGIVNLRYDVFVAMPDGAGVGTEDGLVGVAWRELPGGLTIERRSRPWELWPEYWSDGRSGYAAVPIRQGLLSIGIPTMVPWYLDRRRQLPGHCPCGYDLRGNVSGTCPECGVEVQA